MTGRTGTMRVIPIVTSLTGKRDPEDVLRFEEVSIVAYK